MSAGREHLSPIRGGRWLAAALLLVAVMLYFYYLYPQRLIGPVQPIPFSHRIHAGVKQINCRFCHPFVNRSKHAGLPAMQKCFFCHQYIIPTHPELVKELNYLESNVPVAWKQIYFVPDYVKFQHRPHIEFAKINCDKCHGPVETMDRLRPVNFQMGFCLACHRQRKAPTDCWLTCHH
ncbi:MAG: cytochrome c3 family protein [Desulfobulbaceae bacterium]